MFSFLVTLCDSHIYVRLSKGMSTVIKGMAGTKVTPSKKMYIENDCQKCFYFRKKLL